jgi:hypothetical protein
LIWFGIERALNYGIVITNGEGFLRGLVEGFLGAVFEKEIVCFEGFGIELV